MRLIRFGVLLLFAAVVAHIGYASATLLRHAAAPLQIMSVGLPLVAAIAPLLMIAGLVRHPRHRSDRSLIAITCLLAAAAIQTHGVWSAYHLSERLASASPELLDQLSTRVDSLTWPDPIALVAMMLASSFVLDALRAAHLELEADADALARRSRELARVVRFTVLLVAILWSWLRLRSEPEANVVLVFGTGVELATLLVAWPCAGMLDDLRRLLERRRTAIPVARITRGGD